MFMIAVAAILFVACDGRAVGTNNNSNAAENALETKASKKGMTVLRKLNYFNSINVNVPCDVYFTQGNASKARIVGTQEAISKLEFVVDRNGQLSISSKKSCNNFFSDCNTENLKIYLTSIDLIALNLMGAGDFKTLTPIDTDNLSVAMSGAGDIDFEKPVICDNFSVVLRGAGDIDFKRQGRQAWSCMELATLTLSFTRLQAPTSLLREQATWMLTLTVAARPLVLSTAQAI